MYMINLDIFHGGCLEDGWLHSEDEHIMMVQAAGICRLQAVEVLHLVAVPSHPGK